MSLEMYKGSSGVKKSIKESLLALVLPPLCVMLFFSIILIVMTLHDTSEAWDFFGIVLAYLILFGVPIILIGFATKRKMWIFIFLYPIIFTISIVLLWWMGRF